MDDLTILGKKVDYPKSPKEAKLETFKNQYPDRDYTIEFVCPEFTSICPITGQPDFATIYITYIPDEKCIESKSLKLYLASYRNTGIFSESATNKILDDIESACNPKWAEVVGKFNVRGGISINITAKYEKKKS